MHLLSVGFLSLCLVTGVCAGIGQQPFFGRNSPSPKSRHHGLSGARSYHQEVKLAPYDAGSFTTVESLRSLHTDSFTILGHPAFPNYSVRVKRSDDFCDGTVPAYTGYIDVEVRHLFFYFFESRSNPEEDDVIFWTTGGPGCSSSIGLFMELGPCKVANPNGNTTFNPFSWNSNANMFFVDQPVGVGFSYADHGEYVSTTEEAAKDIAAFVSIFFENFSQFKGRPFHMAGSSYGGRYIPIFAAEVYDQNPKLIEAGLTPINLKSAIIGNGVTDFASMMTSFYDIVCTGAAVDPILDISTCVRMKQAVPRCEKLMKDSCVDMFDAISCSEAMAVCGMELSDPFYATGKNPYDLSQEYCNGPLDENLCYPIIKHISQYLDRPEIRSLLGADPSLTEKFEFCSGQVGNDFSIAMDEYHPTYHYVSALLERGVRTIIYVGVLDWICNWVGNERWTLALEWSGQEEFKNQALRDWFVDGQVAGQTRSAKGGLLTFATIDGAGHMPAYDKPKESLVLLNRWLKGEQP
ncbi:hypothetical protein JAAARDRAFT_42760 [Jaapia argillacea MUCL 33604]|uniref:carboxypeptidase C n=1 Tax=Jaapia argillacea MUCL 33604 TaxID=933084 RepID=A0A067P4A5_9AGAM|nr:hypothetical protein JAAARDRAFT_42760 [Jaapia argillacea MUCL 33604]